MIVISDATPIISLAKIDKLDVLSKFYNEVVLPQAVYDEVCSNPRYKSEAEMIQACAFIEIETITNNQSVKILRAAGLDLGESEAIVLADSLPDSLLLMDERKGRQIASSMGIRIIGTLGLLLQAKKQGLIKDIKQLLDTLIDANIRISESLYQSILEQADELK